MTSKAAANGKDKTSYKNIKVETQKFGVCLISIDRPKVLNALNTETLHELRTALREIETDEKIRAVVLTGSGEKSFIAGADIAEMSAKNRDEGIGFAKLGHEVTKLLELMPKPTIAAVNGFALGGGTELAIACDFILAADNALFGQPEVSLGIVPGFGGTVRLARFVGWPRAKELLFSGRKVKADEAAAIGLANRVIAKKDFMKEVMATAETISKNSSKAVSVVKRLTSDFSESIGLFRKLDMEAREFGSLFGSHDQKEGMGAFLEKRSPKFEGLA